MKIIKTLNVVQLLLVILIFSGCKKGGKDTPANTDTSLSFTVNGVNNGTLKYTGLTLKPNIKFTFTEAINTSTVASGITLTDAGGATMPVASSFQDGNKTLTITPQSDFKSFTSYTLTVNDNLKSAGGGRLINPININLVSGLDNSDKFTRITDDELLTLVQQQTFKYFWDFAHPVSGLARERNTSGNTIAIGGSGFGIMAIVTGIHRNFITKAEGLARLQKIVDFLKNKATRHHGAYPHWLDGNTGATLPFSAKDNGADLVETSYLMQGLITARQYFNGADAAEVALRADINAIYNGVEWAWFRKDNSNVLYWHWSPTNAWEMNLPIQGWNECLITYVLAAASPTSSIPKTVYDQGWAKNGAMKNGNSYYGVQLPLGIASGGPLFFAHYSFLGINPMGLTDAYANYETQNKAHTLINYNYCVANPLKNAGYSADCWGLTASDLPNGYGASSPTNDKGVIAPTAALSSFPYTPTESMQALKFFYYKLGDKIWKDYGFVDAFNLNDPWFASSTLAIDQGPIIIMIENHRSKLLWNLFMSAPEVKTGMRTLGFASPNL
ncbi:glucoamylase family protein [Pedobacter sp. Hv1]|uniref:glucoamylase family protein n=1 Tax=Pedobacter sp. Hv1 TaxID=1740090 RepID=UPI0006D8C97B|nr:glucoamylase family protein [Pedobacter sp. Hv1]KQC02844.1 beta-glucosidase [Pedobacter sp. Hv1]